MQQRPDIGVPLDRIDGVVKVTGRAHYAAEYEVDNLLYGVIIGSAIARGRIIALDTDAACSVSGVVTVMTHENRPHVPWFDMENDGQAANSKPPFRALYNDEIVFSGQPIALVVATSFEAARRGAMLVKVRYETAPHNTSLERSLGRRYTPERKRENNITRGDVETALRDSPFTVQQRYHLAMEHHNPMEMHGSTVQYHGDGRYTLYDKNQGSQNAGQQIEQAFGLNSETLTVLNPYVGGAFGSGLRPAYQGYLAMLAAIMLKRSIRVSLTRQQMFSHVHRPECLQDINLACQPDGKLAAIGMRATTSTSNFEAYTENILGWGPSAYPSPNLELDYAVAGIDTPTPGNMRAPGAATGMTLFEMAMDELAEAAGMDPLAMRLANYADYDGLDNKPYTSKALKQAYEDGSKRFGWEGRPLEPGVMTDGKEKVGWGMATALWEALVFKTSARVQLDHRGELHVTSAASDIGTGTCTIMAQVAAGALGLPLRKVHIKLGDSRLPEAPLEGGSAMAASVGSAIAMACRDIGQQLHELARESNPDMYADTRYDDILFHEGSLCISGDPSSSMPLDELVVRSGKDVLQAEATIDPEDYDDEEHARNTHGAIFAEVKVDEELGVVRVTRMVAAIAAGNILNPKTARSQILGGLVMGIGMALQEESMFDHRFGRIMNHNLAEYHIPSNADIHSLDVLFIEEQDSRINPLGAKGVGEIGIVGAAAAIANAIWHATGKRVRSLPITLDKLL